MGASHSKTKKFKQVLAEKLTSIYPPPETQVIRTESKEPTILRPQNFQKVSSHEQPIERELFPKDRQEQVQTTAEWPNRAHGLFTIKFENITCWGTGVMIGPNIVLTAGHHLYNFQNKAYTDLESMKLSPRMNDNEAPFGSVEVAQYFVSPDYIKEGKEDYGILVLKEPIGDQIGYFGLTCCQSEVIKKKRITLPGKSHETSRIEATPFSIYQEERSTSEILLDKNESRALHQESFVLNTSETTILLTRAMYQQIYKWLQQTSFCAFLQLGNKRELEFHYQVINAECISLLMTCNLDGLALLDLDKSRIGDKVIKILAQNTSWINLSQLNIGFNSIGAEEAKALAHNTSWINLSQLNLGFSSIDSEGAKALAHNTSWINLSQLNLPHNNIGEEGAKALAQNASWINLSMLNLRENNIGTEGAKGLAQNTSWINLTHLDLFSNGIGPEGAKALAQNNFWTKLSWFTLDKNIIGSEGAKALAQNSSWTNLSVLNLSKNNIGAEGAKGLAQNVSWVNLTQLALSTNGIRDEGVKALAQNGYWINLFVLELSATSITSQGAKALAENTSWSKLQFLYLTLSHGKLPLLWCF